MNSFHKENRDHIKTIFQEKTGVELTRRRRAGRVVRVVAVAAAVLACCTVTALAANRLFSSLDGDDLALSAFYEGDGIVTVQVENRSGKALQFQETLKLMRWTTGEEIAPVSNDVVFAGTEIEPHSSGVMTIDLSGAYDIGMLEEPLTDDWYYFVLTNNNFVFGQDWMCSVDFAETVWTPMEYPEPGQIDGAVIEHIEESLRPYFETVTFDAEDRRTMNADYVEAYTRLFAEFEGNIVPSVSPVLPGDRLSTQSPFLRVDAPAPGVVLDDSVPPEEQELLVDIRWRSSDENGKLLAAQGEYPLVLSANLPSLRYQDAFGDPIPLLYIFTYEKSAISNDRDHAFIYGRLLSFAELEPYQVYEDDQYVCYEVSGLIYSDLGEHMESFASQYAGSIRFDDQVRARVENIYTYYKENLSDLFYYFDFNQPSAS